MYLRIIGIYVRDRSITRQYFRKADAVVVVYDVTNESSFLNAKHWILSAKEVINEEEIVILLLANKVDLAADDDVLRYDATLLATFSPKISFLFSERFAKLMASSCPLSTGPFSTRSVPQMVVMWRQTFCKWQNCWQRSRTLTYKKPWLSTVALTLANRNQRKVAANHHLTLSKISKKLFVMKKCFNRIFFPCFLYRTFSSSHHRYMQSFCFFYAPCQSSLDAMKGCVRQY